MKNDNLKEELRQAALLAAGPTSQESKFWAEVTDYLDAGTVAKPAAPEVEPRHLTGKPEKKSV